MALWCWVWFALRQSYQWRNGSLTHLGKELSSISLLSFVGFQAHLRKIICSVQIVEIKWVPKMCVPGYFLDNIWCPYTQWYRRL